jgi:hypothetical protein
MSQAMTSSQTPQSRQLVKASIKFDENSNKIVWPSNTNCDVIMFIGLPSCKEASEFISSPQFRNAILNKFKALVTIRLLIVGSEENFKPEHAEKPKMSDFKSYERIVVTFELVQSGRKIIHWKNDHKLPFLSLDLNFDRYSKALAHFVLEFILTAFQSNCTGESLKMT